MSVEPYSEYYAPINSREVYGSGNFAFSLTLQCIVYLSNFFQRVHGVTVSMAAFQAVGRGSAPLERKYFLPIFQANHLFMVASLLIASKASNKIQYWIQ